MNRYIAAAVAVGWALVVGTLVFQTHRLQSERAAHEKTRAEYARYQTLATQQALEAAQRAQEETERRLQAQQEIVDEANRREEIARADAARASAAGQRLRNQIAALTATCSAARSDPAAPGSSAPDAATTDLLADVQRRLGEATDRIARHADDSRSAGLACERFYDSLSQ